MLVLILGFVAAVASHTDEVIIEDIAGVVMSVELTAKHQCQQVSGFVELQAAITAYKNEMTKIRVNSPADADLIEMITDVSLVN